MIIWHRATARTTNSLTSQIRSRSLCCRKTKLSLVSDLKMKHARRGSSLGDASLELDY